MAIKDVELVETASFETDREMFKRTVFTAISDLTRNGKKSTRIAELKNKYHTLSMKATRAFDPEELKNLWTQFNSLKLAYKP